MKLSVIKPIVFSCLLLIKLSGCGKLIDWGTSHFDHGDKRTIDKADVLAHVRSAKVYDQVTTLGLFDVLWLSDDVRTIYADIQATRVGKTAQEKEEFLRRQLAENEHDICFYVFSYVPDDTTLNEKDSMWMIRLDVDGNIYEPRLVNSVELTPIYKMLLDKFVSPYKNVFLVKFSVKNQDDSDRFTPESQHIKLLFNTVDRSTSLSWEIRDFKLLPIVKEKYEGSK